ncbi:hypothetical protein LXA43DRAFT_676176, partial [Ganoderma leucocontextum]
MNTCAASYPMTFPPYKYADYSYTVASPLSPLHRTATSQAQSNMVPLLPAPIVTPNPRPPLRGEGIDRTFPSELTGNDQGNPHRVPRPSPANNSIRLIHHLFVNFTLVPLLAVFGQHILSSFCRVAPSVSVCVAHSLMSYLLTYLATAFGLLILSPFWFIMVIEEPAWGATKFAAGPVGSFALQWLTDDGNGNDPRLLDPFYILLAMSVGHGIVWIISRHTSPEFPWRTINGFWVQ